MYLKKKKEMIVVQSGLEVILAWSWSESFFCEMGME